MSKTVLLLFLVYTHVGLFGCPVLDLYLWEILFMFPGFQGKANCCVRCLASGLVCLFDRCLFRTPSYRERAWKLL